MKGFILIDIKNEQAYKQLKRDGVEIHPIYGEYTGIAEIETEDPNEFKKYVNEIKNFPGVNKVKVLSAIKYNKA